MAHRDLRELTSWKQIAAYLGVSVRTAQLWERERGLPVKRMVGERGRVWATEPELDTWRKTSAFEVQVPRPRWRRWLIAGIAAAVCILAGGMAYVAWKPSSPASFRVHGQFLTVTDHRGRELWTRSFDWPLKPAESYWEDHTIWFGDVDGDHRTEVLFTPGNSEQLKDSPLYCFSENGKELWRFTAGRSVATRKERFAATFVVDRFIVAPIGPNGSDVVVVASYQMPYYPSQIACLSPKGELRGDYWHSGHLRRLAITDIDGDGRQEICAGGISNSYRSATLVVLDPADLHGASVEEDADFQLLGFSPAREKARLLFYRSCLNREDFPYNRVDALWFHENRLVVSVLERPAPPETTVLYEFGPHLELRNVAPSDYFRAEHEKLERAGTLKHPYGRDVDEARSGIRYLRRFNR